MTETKYLLKEVPETQVMTENPRLSLYHLLAYVKQEQKSLGEAYTPIRYEFNPYPYERRDLSTLLAKAFARFGRRLQDKYEVARFLSLMYRNSFKVPFLDRPTWHWEKTISGLSHPFNILMDKYPAELIQAGVEIHRLVKQVLRNRW